MMLAGLRTTVRNQFWAGAATVILAGMVVLADLGEIVAALQNADLVFVVLAVVAGVLNQVVKAVNWHIFFRLGGISTHFRKTFQLFAASRFLNLITPMGQFGGEPVMAYLISKETDASYGNSLATIMTAVWVVLFPLSLFTVIGYVYLSVHGQVPAHIQYFSLVVGLLVLFGLSIGYLGWFKPAVFDRILVKIGGVIIVVAGKRGIDLHDVVSGFITNLNTAFETVREHPRTFLRSVVTISVAFSFLILCFYAVSRAIGIQISIFEIMLLLPVAGVANISPTPGGTGTVEAGLTGAIIVLAGVNLSLAFTAVLLYRLSTYWAGILIGYVGMVSLDLDPGQLISR